MVICSHYIVYISVIKLGDRYTISAFLLIRPRQVENITKKVKPFILKSKKYSVWTAKDSGRPAASPLIQPFSFSPGVLLIMELYQIFLTAWNNQQTWTRGGRTRSVGSKMFWWIKKKLVMKFRTTKTSLFLWFY